MDALALLTEDHRTVASLLERFEAGQGNVELFRELERELLLHAEIEEAEIYPALREMIADEDWRVDRALADHETMKELLTEMAEHVPYTPDFRSRMTKLSKTVRAHVAEEENKLFPEFRRHTPPAELTELGEKIAAAKRSEPAGVGLVEKVSGAATVVVDTVRDKLGV